MHADSNIDLNLAGNYTRFLSDIGVDDEEPTDATLVFEVFADGTQIFDSGIMRPSSPTQSIDLDVSEVTTLSLVVTDAGDGTDFDHGDWAGARLVRIGAAMPTIFNGTSAADSYLLRQDASSKTYAEIVGGGALWSSSPAIVTWCAATASIPSLTFNTGDGNDTLTVDYVNNAPIPVGGVFYDGGAGTGDSLIINGSSGADNVTIANALAGPTAGSINIGDRTTGAQTVEGVTFVGNDGDDTLTIASGSVAGLSFSGGLVPTDQDTLNLNAGSYTFNSDLVPNTAHLTMNVNNAGTSVIFVSSQHLAGLSIANAMVTLAADGSRVINTGTLAIAGTGKLDLSDNDMVIGNASVGSWNGSAYSGVTGMVASGNNHGKWTGNGIVTSQSATFAFRAGRRLAFRSHRRC